MRRAPLWLLSVSAVFLLTGCATTMQLSQDPGPAYLSELRSQYLSENPVSPYRENIYRGEIVKGMDRFGVLASWGYPEKRVRQGESGEDWLYVDTDESSGNSVQYQLAFRNGVLEEWQSTRMNTGIVAVRSRPEVTGLPPVETSDPGAKTVPQN
ncbi:MAG TPA: hypothetical protein VFX92_05030 [Candidatus Krumholzibacteria bacterium]|nr:hypothetical protein [Candidatus Krumholzibacteria bacterium]